MDASQQHQQQQQLDDYLYRVFVGTFSPEKDIREAAEHALAELSVSRPDLVVQLLRFSTLSDEEVAAIQQSANASVHITHNVFLAASIRLRNVISRSDWNRVPYFTEEVKVALRSVIIPSQCKPHISARVRRQLLSTTKEIMLYDYPKRWPDMLQQLEQVLGQCEGALRTTDPVVSPAHAVETLSSLSAALGILHGCCKIYEDPTRVAAAETEVFAQQFIPSLIALGQELGTQWAYACNAGIASGGIALHGNDTLEISEVSTLYAHCLRLTLKSCWCLCHNRLPKVLCEEKLFESYVAGLVDAVMGFFESALLPAFATRLKEVASSTGSAVDFWNPVGSSIGASTMQAPATTTQQMLKLWMSSQGDGFGVFQKSSHWRALKWCYTTVHHFTMNFVEFKACEKRARKVAKIFAANHIPRCVNRSLNLMRWHQEGQTFPLTSKALIMAIETVNVALESDVAYTQCIAPAAVDLISSVLFPRLAFSSDESELWAFNPEEYVRRQTSPASDLFNPKIVCASLLVQLMIPSQSFHRDDILQSFTAFLFNELQTFSPSASTGDLIGSRHVDAALFTLFQFRKLLEAANFGSGQVEQILTAYVIPATGFPIGFLRARAVLVISVFARSIEWSSESAYHAMLESVLRLLTDEELPVRIQTCTTFSRLIRHPYAYDLITPRVATLIGSYFDVMRQMDNDAVIRTLRKTIKAYSATLTQWAVKLCEMLVEHFNRLANTVVANYAEIDTFDPSSCGMDGGKDSSGANESGGAEELTDALMAADEVLETLVTLVRAIPETGSEAEGGNATATQNVFVEVQRVVCPMLHAVLSFSGGSAYGFLSSCISLLTSLIARSGGCVTPEAWSLVPCLGSLISVNNSVDYFTDMLAPLDNYVSSFPMGFITAPLGQLTPLPPMHSKYADLTPADVVVVMCQAVLQSDSVRNYEVGTVPKLFDAILQNMWSNAAMQGWGTVACSSEELVLHPRAKALTETLIRTVLQTAATRPKQTTAVRLVLANTVLSGCLAQPIVTMATLLDANAAQPFFQAYAGIVSTPVISDHLRSYDRGLLVLAMASLLHALVDAHESGAFQQRLQQEFGATAAQQLVHAVNETLYSTLMRNDPVNLLSAFSLAEMNAASAELSAHEKILAKRAAKTGGKAKARHASGAAVQDGDDGDDGDSEYIDYDSDDDDTDDSMDGLESEQWYNGSDGDEGAGDGSEEYNMDDDDDASEKGELQTLIAKARAIREKTGGGGGGFGPDEDLNDDDNLSLAEEEDAQELLAEEDFTSPIDVVNPWELFVSTLSRAASASSSSVWAIPSGSDVLQVIKSSSFQQAAMQQLVPTAQTITRLRQARTAVARK